MGFLTCGDCQARDISSFHLHSRCQQTFAVLLPLPRVPKRENEIPQLWTRSTQKDSESRQRSKDGRESTLTEETTEKKKHLEKTENGESNLAQAKVSPSTHY